MSQPEAGLERRAGLRGLTTSQLKWIALFFMTLDHIAAFGFEIPIVGRYYMPLRLAGRIAAPLFLFALVQGLRHTRSRPKFLLRLYLAGMGSGLFVAATNLLFGDIVGIITPGNIIFTFFYVALYAWAIEGLVRAVRERDRRGGLLSALGCVLPLLALPVYLSLRSLLLPAGAAVTVRVLFTDLLDSFLPTLVSVDYEWGMVLLGVLLYFAGTKGRQCALFGGFCLVCIAVAAVFPWSTSSFAMTFGNSVQCWMVLALPFMMLYNGRRGNGPKWFFYVYYPTHRYAISVLSAIVQAMM